MRNILAIGAVFLATPAIAGSIEPIKSTRVSESSIVRIGCTSCAPLPEPEKKLVLPEDGVLFEVKEIGGETYVYRTESWLGGAPVTYMMRDNEFNRSYYGEKTGLVAKTMEDDGVGEVDVSTTAAVEMDKAVPIVASMDTSSLEETNFELRLEE